MLTGSKQHVFRVQMHRLRCHDCNAYLMEDIPFTSGSHSRITRSLERSVLEVRKHMSIKALANHYGLDGGTVKKIEKRHLQAKFKHVSLKNVTAIGIDEVYMGETVGDQGYLSIVRDMHSGAVLFVGEGKSAGALEVFTQKLRRSRAKIEYIAIDMGQAYASWARENLSDAIIVYDHFHVIKLMNDKLNKVRRRIMRDLEEKDKAALKGKRWHFVVNQENLSENAKRELDGCKLVFDDLATAHYLKETLRNVYRLADSRNLAETAFLRWCALAAESGIAEMETMAKTINKHMDGVLAYWDTGGMTSASMEGFNNKIGWLTRQAYGYRDQEYLILKIYDLPTTKIRRDL